MDLRDKPSTMDVLYDLAYCILDHFSLLNFWRCRMRVSEEFKKETNAILVALVLAALGCLVGGIVCLINGLIKESFPCFLFFCFFGVVSVISYRGDKKTYLEIQEEEAQEEATRRKQLTTANQK